jgi:hypothetical protein
VPYHVPQESALRTGQSKVLHKNLLLRQQRGPITYQMGALVGTNVKKIYSRCCRARPNTQGLKTAVGGKILPPEEEEMSIRRGTGSCTMKSTLKTGRLPIPTQELIT